MIRIFAAAFALIIFASSAYAGCASRAEHSSITMRALQSELMVAALSCGMKEHYNRFIGTYSEPMKQYGQTLKAYFKRQHGSSSEHELNRFVTQLANQASRISLDKDDSLYCRHAGLLFQFIEAQHGRELGPILHTRYQPWHNIANCEAQQLANKQ